MRMAVIRFEGEEREIPDGSTIVEVCEEMGLPFGCQDGICGTCTATVLEGMECLGPKNESEEEMDLEKGYRLVCQCKILTGIVEFSLD